MAYLGSRFDKEARSLNARPQRALTTAAHDEQWQSSSASFYIEVMLLVVCILFALVVLVPFFSGSRLAGTSAVDLTDAVVYAQDMESFFTAATTDEEFGDLLDSYSYKAALESFPVDAAEVPSSATTSKTYRLLTTNGMEIVLKRGGDVAADNGVLRALDISIFKGDALVYSLDTSRYVSSREGGAS